MATTSDVSMQREVEEEHVPQESERVTRDKGRTDNSAAQELLAAFEKRLAQG